MEAPYHRRGKFEDYIDFKFTFNSISDLKKQLDDKLPKIKDWFDGKNYKEGKELNKKIYAKGGITKEEAIKEALRQGVDFEKDFHAQSKGNELVEIAKKQGYQKPKSASGSRGRYFFYYLQKEYDKNKKYGYYDDYAKGGKLRTNSKEVREKVRQHILDSVYDENEEEFDTFGKASKYLVEEFKRVADYPYNLKRIPNNQERFEDYLRGIPFHFEFENYKIEEFLNSLGINPENKEYDSDEMWRRYGYLIWKEIEDDYYGYAKGGSVGNKEYELKSWYVDVYEDSYEEGEGDNV